MPKYNITIKTETSQLVASIRQVVSDIGVLGSFFAEVEEYVTTNNGSITGPGVIIYHDPKSCENGLDAETAFPIAERIPETDRIRVYETPQYEVAYLLYTGTYEGVGEAHQALTAWVDDNGYQQAGVHRVVFLQCGDSDGESSVEIQYAVNHS